MYQDKSCRLEGVATQTRQRDVFYRIAQHAPKKQPETNYLHDRPKKTKNIIKLPHLRPDQTVRLNSTQLS